MKLASASSIPKKRSSDEGCTVDQGDYVNFLKAEEKDHQQKDEGAKQPTPHLNEHYQLHVLVAKIAQLSQQLTCERNKAAEENHQLKSNIRTLRQSLEVATFEDLAPRREKQKGLDGLLDHTSLSNLEHGGSHCQLARFPIQLPEGIVCSIALHLGRHVFPFLLAIRYGQSSLVLCLLTDLSAFYYFRGRCSTVI
jgi:regulator of replication initiation timing